MAVTQVSRIQHRRGLQQDLPQLASAELGWSIDTRKLYIGNGSLDEGAPSTGVTRILTEHDVPVISQLSGSYTFVGNVAGNVAQTGTNLLTPTRRSYQQKLDDFVNVRDFGATGDGSTDDTEAINRILQQIYKTGSSETQPLTRRTIYFPGGQYKITDTITIPTFARLVGDGSSSVIIKQESGNRSVANICDSKFQTGANIGNSGAVLPGYIEISGIQFLNSNATITRPLMTIDSASNIRIYNSSFVGNSTTANCVNILSTVEQTRTLTFDTCNFLSAGNGVSVIGNNVESFRITNSQFDQITNSGVFLGESIGFISIGNFYGNVGKGVLSTSGLNFNFALGDHYYGNLTTNLENVGLALGNVLISGSHVKSLDNNSSFGIGTLLSNTSMIISYEISTSTARRFGTFNYFSDGTDYIINDDYSETAISANANLTANSTHLIGSVAGGTGQIKLFFTQFN